ncbi:LysR family transcriptional regulator [Thaumasiovibrio subtropicus]|uniref:LysR family transcriptional regulator n=1 Tax=Thaumasiovibrio subtropicus TaxID=1891207 RepID=UPI000B34B53E|nr:LysR family transcriptional regulator [Thaumasiovibrio subtropicus]
MLLEGIETLLVLGKERTMSRTGSKLYISQSAVSKRITNLEKKLGKKLIEPDGRYVRLTEDAQALIASIGPSFNELRGRIYEQQSLEERSLIRIDCSETVLAGLLHDIIPAYMATDPHLTLTTNNTPRIVENVKSGRAMVGVCAGNLPPQHGLMTFHLFDEPFYIVSREAITELPAGLITNNLTNTANTYQASVLQRLGIEAVMEIGNYVAAAQLAMRGAPPAIVPLMVARTLGIDPRYLFYFEDLAPLHRPIHICVRQSNYRIARVKAVIEAILDAAPTATSTPLASTL